jgi:hypothetical protein
MNNFLLLFSIFTLITIFISLFAFLYSKIEKIDMKIDNHVINSNHSLHYIRNSLHTLRQDKYCEDLTKNINQND